VSDEGARWEETRRAWEQVGQRFAEVGRRVEERYRTMEGDRTDQRRGERATGDALDNVVRQLDQAFTTVGETFRDAEAKETLQRAVRSFGDALATTFSEVGERIRGRIGSEAGAVSSGPGREAKSPEP
jgi:hypothetical protein